MRHGLCRQRKNHHCHAPLRRMRDLLNDRHGIVALLSFSNVAVDTLRRDYHALESGRSASSQAYGVEIDTVDGFITTNIIRPHSHRTMKAPRTAFLVNGREGFLKGFTVWDGKRGTSRNGSAR